MSRIRILHAADLHLDSPFEGLPAAKAAQRRQEQRELLKKMANTAEAEQVQLVLLSGDLLDSDSAYTETAEELVRALGSMSVPVIISPGNHDRPMQGSPSPKMFIPSPKTASNALNLRSLACVCGAQRSRISTVPHF